MCVCVCACAGVCVYGWMYFVFVCGAGGGGEGVSYMRTGNSYIERSCESGTILSQDNGRDTCHGLARRCRLFSWLCFSPNCSACC